MGEANTASSGHRPTGPSAALKASTLLTLHKLPAIRPHHMARARLLLADPAYPSREVLRGVARTLARRWTDDGE